MKNPNLSHKKLQFKIMLDPTIYNLDVESDSQEEQNFMLSILKPFIDTELIESIFGTDIKKYTEILDTLKKYEPHCLPFLQKVPKHIENYYKIILNPMDLGKMTRKVKKYKCVDEFKADLDLIWDNCLTFNRPSLLTESAIKMRERSNELLCRFFKSKYGKNHHKLESSVKHNQQSSNVITHNTNLTSNQPQTNLNNDQSLENCKMETDVDNLNTKHTNLEDFIDPNDKNNSMIPVEQALTESNLDEKPKENVFKIIDEGISLPYYTNTINLITEKNNIDFDDVQNKKRKIYIDKSNDIENIKNIDLVDLMNHEVTKKLQTSALENKKEICTEIIQHSDILKPNSGDTIADNDAKYKYRIKEDKIKILKNYEPRSSHGMSKYLKSSENLPEINFIKNTFPNLPYPKHFIEYPLDEIKFDYQNIQVGTNSFFNHKRTEVFDFKKFNVNFNENCSKKILEQIICVVLSKLGYNRVQKRGVQILTDVLSNYTFKFLKRISNKFDDEKNTIEINDLVEIFGVFNNFDFAFAYDRFDELPSDEIIERDENILDNESLIDETIDEF
ncbi:hypothetical protein EDEG_03799 [Edhazardia aedis USNM 41457]|uniref:Bromo domain-containing protein n=1 Tax=Edhazardia aedis (strain USNM 41457) TaxID=1003232 RepID=J9DGD2_EDHAE|nr:hypothetical protein EDEG_03799 [Edhazardia aedis USNM 41457]|eukprot:EJW01655.1 hypothetical protein EDEG_03799 [Edhazardia aedis USNM 41457]